jgi:hypothetical protein
MPLFMPERHFNHKLLTTGINKKVIIIGGGAAGFFAAINIAMRQPEYDITILEKTNKLLSKVRVSGGGRCNVTHHCFDNAELLKNYPRGNKELVQVFSRFTVKDTITWFREQGVRLKTEEDGRMFPESDSSETIVNTFLHLASKYSIKIITQCEVKSIEKKENGFDLNTSGGKLQCDSVICSSGGNNKSEAYSFLKSTGHKIISPLPSLFTVNLPSENIKKELQGISVPQAEVRIEGSKLKYNGPVLITHWGLSGPAVLKLSAFAAKEFYEADYKAGILVNWIFPHTLQEAVELVRKLQKEKAKALPWNFPMFGLPRRLWEFLCTKAGIDNSRPWAETGSKQINALAESLVNSRYKMEGKTTFKEEFVTCGGIDLKEIDFKKMESKLVPGLFFCGEVLNIDGITGGFNFQSAWSTAWIAAQSA